MVFKPLDTQKMTQYVTSRDFTGLLLTILVAVIAWIGSSLINRVDQLTETFNAYALRMENRVTAIEQHVRTSKEPKE